MPGVPPGSTNALIPSSIDKISIHPRSCVFFNEFEFVLKYGNKRTVKPDMVIHQIKS